MHHFRLLFFLLVITASHPCKASDSLLNQSCFSAINFTKYLAHRAHSNSTDSLPLFKPATIALSFKIPENQHLFIAQYKIQDVSLEVFEKRESIFSSHVYTPGSKLFFWKGTNTTNKPYGQEEWGLLRNENASVWKKVGRGEKFIGGVELLGIGILLLMPKEVTKWPENCLAQAGRNIKRAFTTPPVMDKDNWQLNYVGHPLAGALYYNTLRSQNATWFQSFLFATAQSFIWEYVIEGMAEPPSIQDLIVTPVAGAILGEAFHQLTMSMRKNGFSFVEKVVTLIINPMFVINNGFGPKHNPVFVK